MVPEYTNHDLTLSQRQKLTISGVEEVVSFDDSAVVLRTPLGMLMVHGQTLQLKTLSVEGGQTAVEGQISALVYEEPKADGWLRRLLG